MNYRHHFHAGNFADLLKHAVLLDLLRRAAQPGTPAFDLIETHAGAGVYAIGGDADRGSEAEAGVGRLLATRTAPPALLVDLAARVRAFNGGGPVVRYPGSPLLGAAALRAGDRYVGCELRPDDHAALVAALRLATPTTGVEVRTPCADGYTYVERLCGGRPRVILIDPPYERGDESQRIVELVYRIGRASRADVVAIWAPLKDLEALDRLRAGVEAVSRVPGWIVEARLRPLRDPLKMNGCALIVLGASEAGPEALAAASWISENLGESGAAARLQPLAVPARNLRGDRGFVSVGQGKASDVRLARKASSLRPRR